MGKVDDLRARLLIAEKRLRWYEDAFTLIRQAIDNFDEYEVGSARSSLRDIEKIVGGPCEIVE